MKTNKMMRIASVLLVAVILTTCAISGTFAKYTTSVSATDSARVAYWGFDAAAIQEFDLFATSYKDTPVAVEDSQDNDVVTVKSSNSDDVVAPGTSNSESFSFGYTAKGSETNALTAGAIAAPEVDYLFKVEPTMTGDYDALDSNANFKWTLKKGEEEATEYNTVALLLDAIKALSGNASGSKYYNAGELPTAFTAADEVYTIGWKWTYHNDEAGDIADTAMGNAQDLDDVTFAIAISAVQQD